MKKFWIVCNFESEHWLMSQTRHYETKKEALDYAKELCGRYGHTYQYHVLRAECVVTTRSVPVRVTELK